MRKNLQKRVVSWCAMIVALLVTFAAQPSYAAAETDGGGTLSGKVVDEQNLPVIGASVVVVDSTKGETTDANGAFTLTGLNPGEVIEISFLGYETFEVVYNGQTSIQVVLKESSTMADAVVVTALGIKRSEKALSYNVQQVEADAITTVKDANFMNALAGKVAGVQITSAANGAGGPTRVVMRGVKSLTHGNNALYVIDGVPMSNSSSGVINSSGLQELIAAGQPTTESVADINPEDIESISVLNGPAAAALYGSSAANGVVLITTKKGTEGQVKVTFANNTTFSRPFTKYEFQNTYGNVMGSFFSWGDKLATPTDYDPYDFFQTGANISNAITVSMGNQRNQTYFSAATNNSTALVPNSTYNRYNFTIRNTTSFLKDKMKLDFSGSYILQDQKNPVAAGGYQNPLPIVYMWPRGEDFNEARDYEEWDPSRNIYVQRWKYDSDVINTGYAENPYWEMYRRLRLSDKTRYMFNVSWAYDILDWLNVSARVKMDNSYNKNETKVYATTLYPSNPLNTGHYTYGTSQTRDLYGDLLLNINKSWDKFSLSANIGGSFSHAAGESNSISGSLDLMPNHFVTGNITHAQSGYSYSGIWKQREYAAFANVELGALHALYLTLTARNEWSSTLSSTEQLSYFFPSVGLSVVISELVEMPELFDYLKVRGSFADVGSPLQRYLTETYYTFGGGSASQPGHRPVTRLYPEKTDSWEVGVQAHFLKHVNLDVTLYRSNTKKQTIPLGISAASGGYTTMYIQAGNVRNQGIEASLGYSNTWRGFHWDTNLTYSANQNRIIELFSEYWDPVTNKTYYPDNANITSGNNPIRVGNSMGDIYTNYDYVRDPDGNIWVDQSGKVSIERLPEARKLGTTMPKANLGWSNSLSYKGLSLNFLITARIGGLVTSYTQMFLDRTGVSKASAEARDAGGIYVNHGYIDPQEYYNVVAGANSNLVQEYVYSGTNVRLQELSVGYSLPQKWFNNKAKMSVSFIGRNLWMIYCKAPFDPDLSYSTGTYNQGMDFLMMPSLRNLGFSVKFEF